MASGILKQLSERAVPPPPEEFDRELNTRLNDRLLLAQLADFVCRAIPYTFLEFGRALVGSVLTAITGHAPGQRRRRR